jgi:hypothetical protein
MKNKETYEQIINGYNNQLLHWDAKKKVIEKMIKDLNDQYTFASDEWNHINREKQSYINKQ